MPATVTTQQLFALTTRIYINTVHVLSEIRHLGPLHRAPENGARGSHSFYHLFTRHWTVKDKRLWREKEISSRKVFPLKSFRAFET